MNALCIALIAFSAGKSSSHTKCFEFFYAALLQIYAAGTGYCTFSWFFSGLSTAKVQLLTPANGTFLNSGDQVTCAWSPLVNASSYLHILRDSAPPPEFRRTSGTVEYLQFFNDPTSVWEMNWEVIAFNEDGLAIDKSDTWYFSVYPAEKQSKVALPRTSDSKGRRVIHLKKE